MTEDEFMKQLEDLSGKVAIVTGYEKATTTRVSLTQDAEVLLVLAVRPQSTLLRKDARSMSRLASLKRHLMA